MLKYSFLTLCTMMTRHSFDCTKWQGTTFILQYDDSGTPFTVQSEKKLLSFCSMMTMALLSLYTVRRNCFNSTVGWQWYSFPYKPWFMTRALLSLYTMIYDDNGTPSTIHHYDKALFSLYSIMTMALLSLQHTSWWQGTPFTLQYDENGTPFTKHRDKALLSL